MNTPSDISKRPKLLRTAATLGVVGVALLASIASTEENEPTRVDNDDRESEETTEEAADETEDVEEAETFAVGDVVALGDWQVQVHGVTDPDISDNEFFGPDAGERWVTVDTEVVNNGENAQTVSSMMCFELMDGEGFSYSMALAPDTSNPPDGEVAPGGNRRGTITYEIPEEATDLTLVFQCDLFSRGSAVIAL